jgi:hypothetical protein
MLGRLILRLRLARGKCSKCVCPIPDWDLSDSIVGNNLICKKCRNEGAYEGRCPICNNGKLKSFEDKEYSFEEVHAMHENCFLFLINDYKYQYAHHPDYLLEKRTLECASCHHYILRDNPGCPRCKKMAPFYKEQLSHI